MLFWCDAEATSRNPLSLESSNTCGDSYRLEYAECQEAIAGLTYAQFEALDANQSGGLSELELEKVLAPTPGCNLNMDGTRQTFHENKGDIADLGLALLVLLAVKHPLKGDGLQVLAGVPGFRACSRHWPCL